MADAPPASAGLARRVMRGAAYLGAAQYAVMAIGVLKTPVLGRLVDPAIFGIFFLGNTWVSFLSLFRMELREVVISDPAGSQARLNTQFTVEVATSLAGAVLALALFLVAPGIASLPVWQTIFTLMGVRVFSALTSTPLYILHRDIRQEAITRLTLIGAAAGAAAGIGVAFLGCPLLSLLLDAAIPVAVLGAGAWFAAGWRPTRTWDTAVARDSLSFGFTLWTNGLLGKVTFELDDWLVGNLRGNKALGFYGKAYSLAKMPMDIFAGVIGGIALSMYAQSFAAGREVLERAYRLTTWLLTRIVAWSSIVVLAAAEEIVLIMLGPKWGPVPLLVRLMSLYVLGRPLFQNNAQLLVAIRQEKQMRVSQFAQAAILIAIAPLAVYLRGAEGASVAVSVMMVAGFAISQWHTSQHVHAPLANLYLLPALLAAALTPLTFWLGQVAGGGVIVPLLVKGAAATAAFGGVTWLFERQTVREVVDVVTENLIKRSQE